MFLFVKIEQTFYIIFFNLVLTDTDTLDHMLVPLLHDVQGTILHEQSQRPLHNSFDLLLSVVHGTSKLGLQLGEEQEVTR